MSCQIHFFQTVKDEDKTKTAESNQNNSSLGQKASKLNLERIFNVSVFVTTDIVVCDRTSAALL